VSRREEGKGKWHSKPGYRLEQKIRRLKKLKAIMTRKDEEEDKGKSGSLEGSKERRKMTKELLKVHS